MLLTIGYALLKSMRRVNERIDHQHIRFRVCMYRIGYDLAFLLTRSYLILDRI